MNTQDFENIYKDYLSKKLGINGDVAFELIVKFLNEHDANLKQIFETNVSLQAKIQAAFVEGLVAVLAFGKKSLEEEMKKKNFFLPGTMN